MLQPGASLWSGKAIVRPNNNPWSCLLSPQKRYPSWAFSREPWNIPSCRKQDLGCPLPFHSGARPACEDPKSMGPHPDDRWAVSPADSPLPKVVCSLNTQPALSQIFSLWAESLLNGSQLNFVKVTSGWLTFTFPIFFPLWHFVSIFYAPFLVFDISF